MIELKRILVATDFSDYARAAMKYAAALAAKFGAEVVICHVLESHLLSADRDFGSSVDVDVGLQASRATAMAEEWLAEFGVKHGRVLIEHGHAFVEIVRLARNEEIDLVVVGTHGHGAIAHMLLGSVAEKVVRKAPCPVLVVREEAHRFESP